MEPAAQQLVARARLGTLGHDIFARGYCARGQQPDLAAGCFYVLQHHHGIGAGWNGCAGHDLPGRPMRKRTARPVTGARGARNRQQTMPGRLGSAAGKPVARGAGKGRLVAIGADGSSQHSTRSRRKRNLLNRGGWPQPRSTGRHQFSSLRVARQTRTHGLDCRGSQVG